MEGISSNTIHSSDIVGFQGSAFVPLWRNADYFMDEKMIGKSYVYTSTELKKKKKKVDSILKSINVFY